jgi:hypothetical protein
MLPINITRSCADKRLFDVINNVARETYHPKGCYVENVSGRQRWNRTLQPSAVERGFGMGSNKKYRYRGKDTNELF